MSIPNLPVTIDLKTVTAVDNGGAGAAEPYLLTVFFSVDGGSMKIVQRPDGKLVLNGTPVVRQTDSRHDNLPKVRDGETVQVPDQVGRHTFALKPMPLPGDLGELVIGGASGVAGMLYVLAEEDNVSDDAIRAGYAALVKQFTVELQNILAGVVVDPTAAGSDPLAVSSAVKEAITARIQARVRQAILANSNLVQKFLLVNKDDILDSDVLTFTEAELLADPSRPFSKPFDVRGLGDWRIAGSADATIPPDFNRRRRVTFDLSKLTCVTPTDGALAGGDEPYMWNVFFTVDGTSVSVRDDLRLSGHAQVVNTPGSHGNLGAGGVSAGQTIEIPDAVGRASVVLDLIRFPAGLSSALVGGVSGVAGCVSVLLEQDLVAANAAEAGHQAFNAEVKRILDQLIPTLGVGDATPNPDDLAALSGRIGEKVREAILEEGNILQDLFAGVDPDDVVGFNVFLVTHKQLLTQPPVSIAATYGQTGRYDLAGSVTAVPA